MAANLSALLTINARVKGADAIADLNENIIHVKNSSDDLGESFKKSAESSKDWKESSLTMAAITAGLALATKAAVDFEDSINQVRKVIDGIDTPASLKEIRKEIIDLSTEMPITAKGFADIYAAAGASGIAKREIKDFAVLVAQISTAFDMTEKDAGTALAQMRTALGLTNAEVKGLGDAMNYLENNTGASASQLVEFMTRSGAVGKIAGMSAEDTAAFGAAMIQTGVETEIAATSFNNMVKALSRGPSMTERQVEALRRLGYEMADATEIEKDMTSDAEAGSKRRLDIAKRDGDRTVAVVREQSERRIEIAENETDDLLREISRRYRDQLKILNDSWEDESDNREEALQDAAEIEIKGLRRQEQYRINQLREYEKQTKINQDQEIEAIRDHYDSLQETIRDRLEDQLKEYRRSLRDRKQAIEDGLQDQEDAERNSINARLQAVKDSESDFVNAEKAKADQRYNALEQAENQYMEQAKAHAKKTGEQLALASTQGFSDRLQSNAVALITEVLTRINNLPKSQQTSVISDLFGDEARGLAPLIGNVKELDKVLGLVAQKEQYLGSVAKEAQVRFNSSSAELQKFNNSMEALKIAAGETLIPVLVNLLRFLSPIVKVLADIVTNFQGFITTVLERTVILKGLSVVIGPIVSLLVLLSSLFGGFMAAKQVSNWMTGIKVLAGIPTPLRMIAVALTAIGVAGTPLGPIISAISTALLAFQAIKLAITIGTWIKGLTVLGTVLGTVASAIASWPFVIAAALIAIGVLIYKFRDEIGSVFKGIWEGITKGFNVVKDALVSFLTSFPENLETFADAISASITKVWDWLGDRFNDLTTLATNLVRGISDIFKGIGDALAAPFRAAADMAKGILRSLLTFAANIINTFIAKVNQLIRGVNNVSSKIGLTVPEISYVSVPQFATGAFVKGRTLAEIGEGGQPEYVIPANRMASASQAYLQGARGIDVVNGRQPAGAATGGGRTAVYIQNTGPIMQTPDGSQWARVEDLAAVVEAVAIMASGRR